MKRSMYFRFFLSGLLLLSMLSPVAALAMGDGDKHFKEGMKHEAAEEWDKAVERFALAVSENPKSPEFRLHLVRSLFNASQMYMKKGNTAAKEKDYETAYLAYRRAYAFDPANELAKSEMDRMVRLQQMVNDPTLGNPQTGPNGVKLLTTGFAQAPAPVVPAVSQKLEKLRDIPFPSGVDLQFIIKELSKDLDLNVLFDTESFRTPNRKTYIELKNVTAAQALDYIFLQEGLFFQKVGPRTVLIANQAQRGKFQQLVLRTFYLSNAAPKDIAKVVQTAIPAQPGRSQTIVLTDDATNSITIRDTEENIRLIGRLISSLDKDRAEVVMDVAIYEVNKNDLLQFGNQVGSASQLTNLGGTQSAQVRLGPQGLFGNAVGTAAAAVLSSVIPTGIILPTANLSAFQSKNNTKLLAFSQIHAFNNEDSSARIGQRVPVKSASFNTGANTGQINNGGVVSDVINYEQVGLTLKFKPIVFPNQDVQVAMEIESKDVSGAQTLTPTFTERTIKGTARIQNNKTLLLASVAQGVESNGKQGLPLLGLIPIIGRLFTAPTRDNRQVDIVIAVTPRVIRAPAILPEDEVERSTGSLAVPTNSSLEAMLVEEEKQEMLAAARRIQSQGPAVNANANIQLPDRPLESPEYVKTENSSPERSVPATTTVSNNSGSIGPSLKPIDTGVKTLQLNQTADTSAASNFVIEQVEAKQPEVTSTTAPVMGLRFGAEMAAMKAGEKVRIPVQIQGDGNFASAVVGLKFDPSKVAVRTVSYGEIFGTDMSSKSATPFINQNGKMYVSLLSPNDKETAATGILAYIEIEALVDGKPEVGLDHDVLNFLTLDGKNFAIKRQE